MPYPLAKVEPLADSLASLANSYLPTNIKHSGVTSGVHVGTYAPSPYTSALFKLQF